MIANILTRRILDNGIYTPELVVDYGQYPMTVIDITGQQADIIPNPNLFTIQVTADSSVIDLIADDSKYFILWGE